MAREKICGVYMIRSKIKPDRIYIGGSIDTWGRYKRHFYDLKYGTHASDKLQRHYNKYGKEDLVFGIIKHIDCCNGKVLLNREQEWILHFKYRDTGKPYFNTSAKAGSPNTGRKQPAWLVEKRNRKIRGVKRGKMSAEHKRNWYESRWRDGQTNGLLGKPKPQKVKDKISNTLKGRKQPPRTKEHRKHLSEALKGKVHSIETRVKMSNAAKGRIPWNKGRKMKKSNF